MAQKFEIQILGCGSALPTRKHFPTCQVVNLRDKLILIDCGEGAQLQWRYTGLNWQRITHILLSHAHGDHVFGLPGLLSTMGLLGRTQPLFIHGPSNLQTYLEFMKAHFFADIDYEIQFHAIDTTQHALIFQDRSMEIWSLPLKHRLPCCGYLIKEKPEQRHIRREMIDFYGIPLWAINNIKAGQDWTTAEGEIIPNNLLTTPPSPVRSYAYCSDTSPVMELTKWCEGVDLMYHEATYAETESSLAVKYSHSTTRQAAQIAKEAHAKRLLIGHYSSRYENENLLLQEAQEVFSDTILAHEGLRITP
ncbi:MAG: ribonuclease Z [Bacteroidaceae bacterium]|nr:ribonuclease Z [Bacteroidaceae bacterium]